MTTKSPDDIANARILIVDDNSMSRKLIVDGLELAVGLSGKQGS